MTLEFEGVPRRAGHLKSNLVVRKSKFCFKQKMAQLLLHGINQGTRNLLNMKAILMILMVLVILRTRSLVSSFRTLLVEHSSTILRLWFIIEALPGLYVVCWIAPLCNVTCFEAEMLCIFSFFQNINATCNIGRGAVHHLVTNFLLAFPILIILY